MLSRAEAHAFRQQAQMLALQIGLTPAAHAIGIKPERIRKWNERYKWNVSAIRPRSTKHDADLAEMSRSVTNPINALSNLLAVEADRTRSAMARTARRAFEHADTLNDAQLHEMPRAIALQNHAKTAGIAHAWNQAAANVAVQVNVPLPTESEREEMRSIDAKLDEIAAKLRD